MSLRIFLLSVLLTGAAVQAAPVAVAEASVSAESNGLKISIAPTERNRNEQLIVLRRSDAHINVALQNTSAHPILVHQDWSARGGFSLMLEITAINGRVLETPIEVERFLIGFAGKMGSPDVIEAGGVLVREVRLNLPKKAGGPTNPNTGNDLARFGQGDSIFPFPQFNDSHVVTMRAVFSNDDAKSDDSEIERPVWTGKIASPLASYRVQWGAD